MTNPQYPGAGDQPGGFPPPSSGEQPQPGWQGAGQQSYAPGPQQYPPPAVQSGYGQLPYPPQAGGYYAPPSGVPYPQQPGQRRGTVVMVTLVVLVLVIGLGAGGYFLVSGGGGGDPRTVAQQFVDGAGENEEIICASDLAKIEKAGESAPQPTAPVTMPDDSAATSELVGVDVPEGSDRGTFTVETDVTVGTQSHSRTVEYDLVREDGDWKVCGILEASEPGDSDSEAPGNGVPEDPENGESEKPGSDDSEGGSTAGSDPGDARAVAQQFVDRDGTDKGLICSADVATLESAEKLGSSGAVELPDSAYATRTITNLDVPPGSDQGSFTVELMTKGTSTPIKSLDYDLVEEDGSWKVCGVLKAWLN
ncbi:Rv0361 family membrane protein [Nocardia carnea]|uniref:Rv0361 family membrane protein n=1 Tax=Nocardia carnea TaxID=37328 RepID=UPI002456FE32|nr:hypothetical protein [Nocardia carnea]